MRTILIWSIAGMLAASAADAPKKGSKAATTTMAGCIDQRDGMYVLTGDKELKTIAFLQGDGFSDDNFARYVGHRVTVEGTVTKEAEKQTVKVRKVNDVA